MVVNKNSSEFFCQKYQLWEKILFPDSGMISHRMSHKILAELGDYEIQHLVNLLNDVNEILLNRGRGEQTKSYSQKH